LGVILAVLSGAAFAGMFIFNSRIESEEDHIGAILLGHIITFICCLPFLFLNPPELSSKNVWPFFAMVIFQQVIPFILYAKAIRLCPPLAASLITMTGPILNPILVWIFTGETPGILTIAGGGIIIISIGIWTFVVLKKNTVNEYIPKTEILERPLSKEGCQHGLI
jgi:drug/metabolite transporter (DMT)-like permease